MKQVKTTFYLILALTLFSTCLPKNSDPFMFLSIYTPSWMDTNYNCRKQITLSAGASDIPAGTYVTYAFDHAALVSEGKSLANGDDIRVSYTGDTSSLELDRALKAGSSWNSSTTQITFQAKADITTGTTDSNYFLYYCNTIAVNPPAGSPNIYLAGPFTQVNDTNYKTVATATIEPTATSQVWLWFATFSLGNNSALNGDGQSFLNNFTRITINGTSNAAVSTAQVNGTTNYKMMVVVGKITGVIGKQIINLDIRSENGTATTLAQNIRITTMLLPSTADFQYAENDPLQTPTTNAYTDIANPQLVVTPSSPGDYFIIATGQFGENNTGASPIVRFVNATDTVNYPVQNSFGTLSESANGRSSFDTFFVIRKVTFATLASKTFKFQTNTNNAPAGIQGLRIFAFRTDSFSLVESQEDFVESNTTSVTAVVKSTLPTVSPPDYSDYLIIQSQYLYDNDTTTHQTDADFRMDNTVLADQDHSITKNWDYQFASACVSSLYTNTSHTFQNRYWTNDANATYSKESVIHAIRLKTAAASGGSEEKYQPPLIK